MAPPPQRLKPMPAKCGEEVEFNCSATDPEDEFGGKLELSGVVEASFPFMSGHAFWTPQAAGYFTEYCKMTDKRGGIGSSNVSGIVECAGQKLAPPYLTKVEPGDAQVKTYWDIPNDWGDKVDGIDVYYRPEGSSEWSKEDVPRSEVDFVVDGLVNDMMYEFAIAFWFGEWVNISPKSNIMTATPKKSGGGGGGGGSSTCICVDNGGNAVNFTSTLICNAACDVGTLSEADCEAFFDQAFGGAGPWANGSNFTTVGGAPPLAAGICGNGCKLTVVCP